MKAKDLCNVDIFFLNFCRDGDPFFQYIGHQRLQMNVLASYGLVNYDGNFRYSLTQAGQEILEELEFMDVCEETFVEKENK